MSKEVCNRGVACSLSWQATPSITKFLSDLFIHWLILVELSPNLYCQSDFSLIYKFSHLVFGDNMWWTSKLVLPVRFSSIQIFIWLFVKICCEEFIDSFLWKEVQTCTASLNSEIFWLLLWVFLQNMWWTAHLFTIFLIDSFGVFMKICGEHIHWFIVELSKSKLVLPTWFRNFSDCFLPIWRAFVVVYDLLYQANSQWTIRPIIIKLL